MFATVLFFIFRRDVKYRKVQAKLYNFLERPTGRTAAIYHALV